MIFLFSKAGVRRNRNTAQINCAQTDSLGIRGQREEISVNTRGRRTAVIHIHKLINPCDFVSEKV